MSNTQHLSILLILSLVVYSYQTSTIATLHKLLADEYIHKDTPYWPHNIFPPMVWKETKGTYRSSVHLNFHGGVFPNPQLRNYVKIPDSNALATSLVNNFLLEAYELGVHNISKEHIIGSARALLQHKDKNYPAQASIFTLWHQARFYGAWKSQPVNLPDPSEESHDVHYKLIADLYSMGDFWSSASRLFDIPRDLLQIYNPPADADVTSMATAFGERLSTSYGSSQFPGTLRIWRKSITDLTSPFRMLLKYSYEPFSSDRNKQLIDPRTYYWIRGFLDEQVKKENYKISLITTWFQNFEEQKTMVKKGIQMPSNINSIDATVVANALYGMTWTIIQDVETTAHFDEDVQNLYKNSILLLDWIIRTNALSKRSDLILLYHPHKMDFYVAVARLVFLLANQPNLHPTLEFALKTLQPVAQTSMTAAINRLSKFCEYHLVCWDSFLGNDDRWESNDDRVYTTSLALNALIDVWTVQVNGRRKFLKDIPSHVREAIWRSGKWLNLFAAKSDKYKPFNAYFAGSVKSPSHSLPTLFPSNHLSLLDGSNLPCSPTISPSSPALVAAVSGYIEPLNYLHMLNNTCLGTPTPDSKAPSLNCEDCNFAYWNSPALTYASSLSALAKYVSVFQLVY